MHRTRSTIPTCWLAGLVALLIAWLAATPTVAQQGEKRFALVIGNAAYEAPLSKLNNPPNDAARIAAALREVGFAGDGVKVVSNLSRDATFAEVKAFAERVKAAGPEAIAFLYYSGHGASAPIEADGLVKRRNFLIPVGAPIEVAEDLPQFGVALDDVVRMISAVKARATFVVIDACRTELPFSKGGADADKAYGVVSARPGLLVAFATAEGEPAPDDGKYAIALANELVQPGLKALDVFDRASRAVAKQRVGGKIPWFSNQIDGEIYLKSAPAPGGAACDPRFVAAWDAVDKQSL